MNDEGGRPDVELGGSFRAAELTFHESSGVRVTTTPGEARDEDDHVRQNLPEEPDTGRAYRDVHIRRRVGARLGADVAGGSPEEESHGD
jgi:hypothetical protein